MAEVGIRELLEAGVHFGHQTRRWNPKMRRFIHGEAAGIYLIDLLKTQALLKEAREFASALAHRGGTVLFVGTKKQARDAIKDVAEDAGMPYVNHRWLGGLLTNYQTMSARIKRLHDLERYESEGQLELLPTRERLSARADLAKLQANLGGVKNMQRVPDAMFVVDLKTEVIAVHEAQRLRIPIIGLVDTNCDPDGIDYVVPGNDDAIRSCAVITAAIGDVVGQGQRLFREEEERARREAEEQARREAEERARREAEEQAAREEAAREEERARQRELVTAEGGGDRQVAEAEVAQAVQEGGRPHPDPHVAPKANAPEAQRTRKSGEEGPPSPKPAPVAEAESKTPDPASAVETARITEPAGAGTVEGRETAAETQAAPKRRAPAAETEAPQASPGGEDRPDDAPAGDPVAPAEEVSAPVADSSENPASLEETQS
ncbi:MAG TPA: 30S ribosomal protein S2 [Solirubrobacteraceae bacterium]|nr:30S ribosomal protein S2 [Solirubrobacteraceae bacterium]